MLGFTIISLTAVADMVYKSSPLKPTNMVYLEVSRLKWIVAFPFSSVMLV